MYFDACIVIFSNKYVMYVLDKLDKATYLV